MRVFEAISLNEGRVGNCECEGGLFGRQVNQVVFREVDTTCGIQRKEAVEFVDERMKSGM